MIDKFQSSNDKEPRFQSAIVPKIETDFSHFFSYGAMVLWNFGTSVQKPYDPTKAITL